MNGHVLICILYISYFYSTSISVVLLADPGPDQSLVYLKKPPYRNTAIEQLFSRLNRVFSHFNRHFADFLPAADKSSDSTCPPDPGRENRSPYRASLGGRHRPSGQRVHEMSPSIPATVSPPVRQERIRRREARGQVAGMSNLRQHLILYHR
jgi:hypothetical protein